MKRSFIIILILLIGTASGFAFAPLMPGITISSISQIKPPPRLPAPKPHPPRPRVTVHKRRVIVRRPPPHPHKLHITLPHIKLPHHPGPPPGAPPPPRL